MKRRTILAAAPAGAWSTLVRAQQKAMPVIGWLSGAAPGPTRPLDGLGVPVRGAHRFSLPAATWGTGSRLPIGLVEGLQKVLVFAILV
jgi:hypothetical protein